MLQNWRVFIWATQGLYRVLGRPLSHCEGHKFQTRMQQYKTNNLRLKSSFHPIWNGQCLTRVSFFSIALAFENLAPFERTAIFCVNFGFCETSLGPRQLSRGTLDATLRKDSCLWGFLLAPYTSKELKRRYANASEITGGHWGPRMVVRTILNPRGAWQTVGAAGFYRGLKGAREKLRGSSSGRAGPWVSTLSSWYKVVASVCLY
jgi:hypothetical protein